MENEKRKSPSAFGKWRPTRRTASASDGRCNAASAPSLVFRAHVCGTSGDTGGHHTPLPSGSICFNPFARTWMVRCRNDMYVRTRQLHSRNRSRPRRLHGLLCCFHQIPGGRHGLWPQAVLDRLNADYCYWRHSLVCCVVLLPINYMYIRG